MTLSQIQGNISKVNYLVQSQAEFQTYLYPVPRDTRVGVKTSYAGKMNEVVFKAILPATNYTICGYYQTLQGALSSSSAICRTFLSPNSTWPVYRAVLNFNSSLNYTQRNTLLCYIYNNIKSNINNLIN